MTIQFLLVSSISYMQLASTRFSTDAHNMQDTEHTLRSCVFNKDNNAVKAPHTSLSDTLCFDSNI